ncbi:uncharacterized protein [Nicotiana sylvestris]|uniref:uncharacterized protein n=1 Tax=Nicotiana sylvestris TaxID=4096 RepID=UPI00388C5B8D
MIRVPPNELNATSAHWPFSTWGMDGIGLIEPAASNGHRLILVAIDYFTKWEEAASYTVVTKKVIADFVKDQWIRSCYEQLALIDGKRMNAVCHGQLYQNRMSRSFNKRVRLRQITPGQLVLKRIFLHQDEAKGKFSPN